MKTVRDVAVLLAMLMIAATVHGRASVRALDYENIQATAGSGKPVDFEMMRSALVAAANESRHRWEIVPSADGKSFNAICRWESHALVVRIEPAGSQYSVRYVDSTNLKYKVRGDGEATIHPAYNKLVQELMGSIRNQLLKL
jgi:hypothetical protein